MNGHGQAGGGITPKTEPISSASFTGKYRGKGGEASPGISGRAVVLECGLRGAGTDGHPVDCPQQSTARRRTSGEVTHMKAGDIGASGAARQIGGYTNRRISDVRTERPARVTWHLEWIDEAGQRQKGPPHPIYMDSISGAVRYLAWAGKTDYGIRHGHEVVVRTGGKKQAVVRVQTLHVDGRLIEGDELKRMIAAMLTRQEERKRAQAERIAALDRSLAAMAPPEAPAERPFWFDPAEDAE